MQITAHPRAPIAPNANHSASPNPKNPSSDNLRHPQSRHPAPHPSRPNRPQCKSQCIPKSQPLPLPAAPKSPLPSSVIPTPSSDNLRQSKKHRIQIVGISPRTRLTSSPSAAYPAQRPADPTSSAPHLQSATAATLVRATKKHQSRDKNSPPPPPTSLSTPPTHANYRLQMKIPRFPARFHALSWLSPPCSSHNL